MEEKKKVLMLGGTGAMGVYLAPQLLEQGYKVYITSRSERTSNERDMIFIQGNAKDKEFLSKLLEERYDVIIDFMIYNTEGFKERYEDLLKNTDHYMFLSSYRVYGDSKGEAITEESVRLLDSVKDEKYLATDEYGLTKARQENILKESGYDNWTIIRPAITYSKERFQLGTLEVHEFIKRARQGKTIIFPKQMLYKQATMSWAGDVAKMISKLVLNKEAMKETFTVSTSEHHTWREVMQYYIDLIGMRVKIVDLSVYESVIGRPYQIKYDRMFDRVIDNSKILRVTGMRQEDLMPLKDGLRIELNNFLKNPNYKGFNPALDKRIDEATASKMGEKTVKIKKKLGTIKKLHKEKRLVKTVRAKAFKLPGLRTVKKGYVKIKKKANSTNSK